MQKTRGQTEGTMTRTDAGSNGHVRQLETKGNGSDTVNVNGNRNAHVHAHSDVAVKGRRRNANPLLEKSPSRGEQTLLFARNFFKHPKMLGSLIPSSRFLVNQVLRQINWKEARVIVEYGPGVGTFTAEILRRLRPDARLIVLETNPDFVQFLRSTLVDDRLEIIHESAAGVDRVLANLGHAHADYVISGIPFSTFPGVLRDSILAATHSVLHPQGAFLVYQFSGAVLPYLEKVFGRVSRDFEPLNILPARLFYCVR
jgi:phospholipid N-methyltransferase